jgi:hypothetical protein
MLIDEPDPRHASIDSTPTSYSSLDEASLGYLGQTQTANKPPRLVHSRPIALLTLTLTTLLQLPFKSLRYYNFNTVTLLLASL